MRPDAIPLPPDDPSHPGTVYDDAHRLLASVRHTLADLLNQVRDGDASALRDLGLKQAELETALKRAFDAEGKYNDWQSKLGARAPAAGEIDFDLLRDEIGCRLARLRECCQEP